MNLEVLRQICAESRWRDGLTRLLGSSRTDMGRVKPRFIVLAWVTLMLVSVLICLSYPKSDHAQDVVLPLVAAHATFPAWPPTHEMLSAIADSRGRITVVGVNSGYIDMFYNWARSATNAGLKNILIMALDDDAYRILQGQFPGRTLMWSSKLESGLAMFGTVKFNRLTRTRPSFIRAVLDLGYSVFYTDTDTIFRRNPFDDIDRALEHDPSVSVMVSEDGARGYYCSCMLYFSCDQQSRDLLKAWESVCADQPDHDDQHALNVVINEHIILNRLHLFVIPESAFPSGKRMFDLGYDWNRYPNGPTIVHANFMVGHDRKMQVLQSRSIWDRPSYPLALYDETQLLRW